MKKTTEQNMNCLIVCTLNQIYSILAAYTYILIKKAGGTGSASDMKHAKKFGKYLKRMT